MSGLPGWFTDKATKQAQNARSRGQERRVAREVGGKVQAGSGSSWRAPQDIKQGEYLIQHKGTKGKSIVIYEEVWQECEEDAQRSGREAALVIEFGSGRRLIITSYE